MSRLSKLIENGNSKLDINKIICITETKQIILISDISKIIALLGYIDIWKLNNTKATIVELIQRAKEIMQAGELCLHIVDDAVNIYKKGEAICDKNILCEIDYLTLEEYLGVI